MRRLRDSSEVREAADLLDAILKDTQPRDGASGGGRGERLRRILVQLCARAGFSAAAVASGDGLPLAAHGLPFPSEAAAAAISIMAEALKRVADVAAQRAASSVAIDLTYTDKLVLRRFAEGDATYYLLVLCPQDVDEHAEVEVSIDEIASLVKGA